MTTRLPTVGGDPGTWGQLLNDYFGERLAETFTQYAPAWTSSGTAPVIGNGTLVGRYLKIQRLVFVYVQLTAGTTTTFGSGVLYFAMPVADANNGIDVHGSGLVIDSAGPSGYSVISRMETGQQKAQLRVPAGAGAVDTAVTFNVPFAFGTGDQIQFSVWYEAAA
jgi:hypothetical protein